MRRLNLKPGTLCQFKGNVPLTCSSKPEFYPERNRISKNEMFDFSRTSGPAYDYKIPPDDCFVVLDRLGFSLGFDHSYQYKILHKGNVVYVLEGYGDFSAIDNFGIGIKPLSRKLTTKQKR